MENIALQNHPQQEKISKSQAWKMVFFDFSNFRVGRGRKITNQIGLALSFFQILSEKLHPWKIKIFAPELSKFQAWKKAIFHPKFKKSRPAK